MWSIDHHVFMLYVTYRLQAECGNYRMIAEEAYKQLVQIQSSDVLSGSMDARLRDWLDLMEEVNYQQPTNIMIMFD